MKSIITNIQKADYDYDLIEDGDKIAVGLSGGKDSSLLLLALNEYKYLAAKKFQKNFEIIGIHINLNFGEDDFNILEEYFKTKNISFISEDSKIADILNLYPKNGHIECSRCSQLKKGAVIKVAKEYSCNKICFGHHGDDAIETLFLNMIYGASIRSFEPKMFLSREEVTFIRPFIYCLEEDIIKTADEYAIPRLKSGCPVDGITKRSAMKALLNNIEIEFPGAKKNILRALHNPEKASIWHEKSN